MSIHRIASRYAKSLIDLAKEQGKLERVLGDIRAFQQTAQNRDFYLMLKSPIIKADKKKAVFEALFKDSFDETTMAFLRIILAKGRESYLAEIAEEIGDQYKEIKHISTVKLRTAVPLTEALLTEIKEKLIGSEITFENVEIDTEVDPDLIGGFVVEIGDKMYDASVAHQLEKMKKEFSN